MVLGRTARRSHSRKNALTSLPLFIMTKASGLMARTLPLWRKYRDALCGGSSWIFSQPSPRARSTVSARESMYCVRVFAVPQQLPYSPAGDVFPVERQGRIDWHDTPSLAGRSDRCPIASGQQAQAKIAEGDAATIKAQVLN